MASELFSAGTFVRSGLTQNTEELTTVYRENWLARKIIDMPAEDMTRAWYTLAADIPAAEIPATRLFGRSPQGMNSTGESDLIFRHE